MNKNLPKLYIDINGVLLTHRQSRIADHSVEFIRFALNHFDCYWLTTHCKGDATHTLNVLSSYFEKTVVEEMRKIKPTLWLTYKSEAINLNDDFYWLDDAPAHVEIETFRRNGIAQRLIVIDLSRENELLNTMNTLQVLTAGFGNKGKIVANNS